MTKDQIRAIRDLFPQKDYLARCEALGLALGVSRYTVAEWITGRYPCSEKYTERLEQIIEEIS